MIAEITDCIKKINDKILEIYNQPLKVDYKADRSPITIADKLANEMLIEFLHHLTPEIPIISEELINLDYAVRKQWKKCWILDPLDGTREFVQHTNEFTVNVALIENGEPVFGLVSAPALNRMYYGERGVGSFSLEEGNWKTIKAKSTYPSSSPIIVATSRSHPSVEVKTFIKKLLRQRKEVKTLEMGSSLKLCLVADGTVDVYPRFGRTMEWDIAAGHAIIRFAGRDVYNMNSLTPLTYNSPTLENPFFIAY